MTSAEKAAGQAQEAGYRRAEGERTEVGGSLHLALAPQSDKG